LIAFTGLNDALADVAFIFGINKEDTCAEYLKFVETRT
jgi:hypothetical protein